MYILNIALYLLAVNANFQYLKQKIDTLKITELKGKII